MEGKQMKVSVKSHARYGKCRVGEGGWYVAADICRVLGYTKATAFANKHTAEEDTRYEVVRAIDSSHCAKMLLVNERGLTSIIKASGNIEGDAIKAWLLSATVEETALVAANLPQVFNHPQFGNLRIVIIDNTAWFVGKDVAAALGYAKPADAVRDHVPDKFKGVSVLETPGGKQDVVAINEAGLYKLVMRSRLPEAEKFSDWACGEVLPSINKHGYYSTKPAVNAERIEQRVKKQLSTVSKCEFAVVYLLFLSNLTVKIGYTGDLTQRVKQIQSETGLEVLNFKTTAYMPLDEARALEAKLKEKYIADRIEGEYYDTRFIDICKEI